jgi:hypothetical protein|eukprot:TRINITY_DN44310_c0_g1_i1.p1 TRINITY_DN44310_c0_g1~~TRINITY_DN44310_c0_g1_i1.p1  ORF type:complete len:203 (-),score=26.53 TRINITY_DN44310_c0_g1_i1:44-652(-)
MVHGGQLQGAWHKRRRRLGDSVPGCLLFIAIVLGGIIWGYFKFIHWRPLVNAGHMHKTFPYKKNPPACLEYGRRMRTFFSFQARAMCDQNKELIKKFKAGDYKDHKDLFDADCSALCNSMLDTIQQFDGQEVPDLLNAPHTKISTAHKYCYESVQSLVEAYGAEGAEQSRLVKEAEKKLSQAAAAESTGIKEFNSIWAHTVI